MTPFTEVLKARLEEEKSFLISEHDQDRDAYQKLLADYNSLEQRSEALEKEISRLQRVGTNASGAKKGHQRNLSDVSTASATSELPDEVSCLEVCHPRCVVYNNVLTCRTLYLVNTTIFIYLSVIQHYMFRPSIWPSSG